MASRLVLVIGDLFIPDRAPDIPAKVGRAIDLLHLPNTDMAT